ncbi:peptide deformylase [Arboricoccus pini]|uniref:Peptide deformylase n=1 Tax=Arboricoccus pini TaxID=1963835 RepID=A0A212QX89_9PROT|nr:peptide deformylase [Arboricoccus pini]SNB64354.1 peptide deformylase [Arboricoccus pini]
MTLLSILEVPDARLKAKASAVAVVDDDLRRFMDDMLETMYAAPGIGLAAPQVGVLRRVIVLDVARERETPAPMRLVNPEILWESEEKTIQEEGCLSLPEQYAEVRRPAAVKVSYLDEQGVAREVEAEGLLARCLQHEIDHLNGILFTDHISALKRNMILRKLAKAQKLRA